MKKIYMFLLLLFSVVSMTAQTMPAISDAPTDPTNGQWAANTTWYYVKCGNGCYLDANVRHNGTAGNIALSNSAQPKTNSGVWCLVGDETNGYKFYNKDSGKILSLLNYSTDTWCWAGMTTEEDSSYPLKLFKFQASEADLEDAVYWCLKDASNSSKNRWLCKTQGSDYPTKVSLWDNDAALQSADAAFTFIEVVEKEEAKPITAVSQLSNNLCYTVVTYSRGAWTATNEGLDHSAASNPDTYPAHRFAFISNDGGLTYYLYNVGYKKFISKENNLTDHPVDPIQFINPGAYENTLVMYFDNSHFINIDGVGNVKFDGWGPGGTNSSGCADEGNSCYITPYDEFDPSEALAAFGVSEANMEALIAEAENALSLSSVGYPRAEAAVRTSLQAAIDNAKANKTSPTYYGNLEIALNEYGLSTDILMPENGKAYYIVNVQKNGTMLYLRQSSVGIATRTNASSATIFVCRQLSNGKFAFVSTNGKYLKWVGNGDGGTDTKGYLDEYDNSGDGYTDLQISKMVPGSGVSVNGRELLSYLTIFGRRSTDAYNYITIKSDNTFDQTGVAFFTDANSGAFQFIESTYGNMTELKAADGIDGVDGIATFSVNFPSVVPSGVTAWYVCQDSLKKEDLMTMTKLDKDEAIPAGAGVVLTGNVGNAYMLPAAGETAATLNNNLLTGTGRYTGMVEAGANHYVLGKANGTVAFYPISSTDNVVPSFKAYLTLPVSTESVKMSFGFDATAIERIEIPQTQAAPIYDLSGRRVVKTVKGRFYIQGGKKFIAQ
ncbi:MAG: hypothetical protein J6C15_07055 [Bacteroidaceae bacterium]|nr:hypothetical protein [Bacteroidaceae bacterium]